MEDEEIDEWELMFGNELEAVDEMESQQAVITIKSADSRFVPKALKFDDKQNNRISDRVEKMDNVKSNCPREYSSEELSVKKQQYLYTRVPCVESDTSGSITCTLPDGNRFFLLRSKKTTELSIEASSFSLEYPINTLLDQVEQRQITKAIDRTTFEQEEKYTNVSQGACRSSSCSSNLLWVRKFTPRSFTELLSDERVNRDVLSWIKSWDPFVFPKKSKAKDISNPTQILENDKRPKEKERAPGTGKTTLAHIAAKHAGYNPIEINSSDERTGTVLKERIINAMEMQSVWGDNKPNCLILDEIDGAMNGAEGKSAISSILSIVNAALPVGKKNASGVHPLVRPIICICNNQYAPVLRQLRKVAKVINFQPPTTKQLLGRLKNICRLEKLNISSGILASLCTSSNNDIRYCLNILQLAKASGSDVVTQKIMDQLLSKKDKTGDYYDLWGKVFCSKRGRFAGDADTPIVPLVDLFDSVQQTGYDDFLVDGLHENLPRMVQNDSSFTKTVECLEWLGLSDLFSTRIQSTQQYTLMPYLPSAVVAIHLNCLTTSQRKIEYPKQHKDFRLTRNNKLDIAHSFTDQLTIGSVIRSSPQILAIDIVSSILRILCPVSLYVNVSFQKPKQKQLFQNLVLLYGYLGLSYKAESSFNGILSHKLEPAIDLLIDYKSLEKDYRPLANGVQERLQRDIDLEAMRKVERKHTVVKAIPSLQLTAEEVSMRAKRRNPYAFAAAESAREKKRQRTIENNKDNKTNQKIRFKFQEGYTTGIKRVLWIKNLI